MRSARLAAALFTCCATLVGASSAFAQLAVFVQTPQSGSTHGDHLSISEVGVSPHFPTPTVTATVAGRSTTLGFSPHRAWSGALSLKGLPSGEHKLLIQASNANGQTGQAQVTFIYDPSPVLTLTEPLQLAIGQPDIPIKGTCVDDKGICTVKVVGMASPTPLVPATLLALNGGSFATTVTPQDGEQILRFTPMDSTSEGVAIERKVLVAPAGGLSIDATFQGTILDVDASRALTFDTTVLPRVVRLYDRVGDTSQIIWTAAAANEVVNVAHLTPGNGALVVVESPSIFGRLFEWRGAALTEIANARAVTLHVKGAWAIFTGSIGPCCATSGKFLRDLNAGTNIQFSNDAAETHGDVTPNGRAVFTPAAPP